MTVADAGHPLPMGAYPAEPGIALPEHIANWRPLLHGIMSFPHYVLVVIYGIAAYVVVVLGWFAALFTGRLPDSFANFLAGYFRYQWRVLTFQVWLREAYPTFTFPSGLADDGADPAWLQVSPDRSLNRLAVLFRGIMAIPQAVAVGVVAIGVYAALIVGFFAVLFTGRWPEGLAKFVIGGLRWNLRFTMWYWLLTDQYPPFSLE